MNAMQRFILVSVLFCLALVLGAQTPEWLWAVRAGGTSGDYGYGIALDAAGNCYLTGYFRDSASFGPYTLTSSGSDDIVAAKLDPNGNWLWAVRAGGTSEDRGYGIAVDASGNCYLAGYFYGSASFGPYTLTSSGSYDIFAAKLDTSGNWLWAVRAGGTLHDYGFGIAVDATGNSYLTGWFQGNASFGSYPLTSSGWNDIFAAKLDSNGNCLWAVRAGGTSWDFGYGIAVDVAGNCYLTGIFDGTASFGPYTLTSSGQRDIFTAKLDTSGNWLWAFRAGGTFDDYGRGIAVDASGNAYLTRYFYWIASFGPYTLMSSGYNDIFAAKLDPNGNFLWAVRAGGTSLDSGFDIAVDAVGNCYLTGIFRGNAGFGPYTLTSSGDYDIFVAKLDTYGNWLWAVRAGGAYEDHGIGIAMDSAGNCYLAGYFYGSASFGPYTLTSSGGTDIFVAKLSPGTPVEDELNPPVAPFVLSASPNPFSASTVIKVGGAKLEGLAGNASLDIYSLKGQKVRSLPIVSASPDGFDLNWDGRDERGLACPTGIYLARLDLGGRLATLKLSLVK